MSCFCFSSKYTHSASSNFVVYSIIVVIKNYIIIDFNYSFVTVVVVIKKISFDAMNSSIIYKLVFD